MILRRSKLLYIGMVVSILLLGGQAVLADGEQEFIAKIVEIGEQRMVVGVTDQLLSKYPAGQMVALLLTEDTIYRNQACKVISLKAFTKGMLVLIKPATLSPGKVRADIIKMER